MSNPVNHLAIVCRRCEHVDHVHATFADIMINALGAGVVFKEKHLHQRWYAAYVDFCHNCSEVSDQISPEDRHSLRPLRTRNDPSASLG